MFMAGPAAAADGDLCVAAGTEAERRHDIPSGLLLAIGRIESGSRDQGSGRVLPWPWTINAAGAGQRFTDLPAAVAATRTLLGRGVASIDVGCFQVNLQAHPQAFASLEQGFDPPANADYAGRFLSGLRTRIGNWDDAVAAYHSATPERGVPYRVRVMADWGGTAPPGGAPPGALPARLADWAAPFVVTVVSWSPQPAGAAPRVWTPTAGPGAPAARIISFGTPAPLPTVRTLRNSRS